MMDAKETDNQGKEVKKTTLGETSDVDSSNSSSEGLLFHPSGRLRNIAYGGEIDDTKLKGIEEKTKVLLRKIRAYLNGEWNINNVKGVNEAVRVADKLVNALKRFFGIGTGKTVKELDETLKTFLENFDRSAYVETVEAIAGEKVFERKVDAKETDKQGKGVKYSMKDKRKSAPETVSVLKEHLQTAISSTDGTNLLNKIDTAI